METDLYNELNEFWINNKFKYYDRQDITVSGKSDCDELYSSEQLGKNIEIELAEGLIELITSYEDDTEGLGNYIKKFNMVKYYEVFLDKIDVLIKESILTREEISVMASTFIKENTDYNIIKLGLILLKYSNNEEALEILKAFSNHNEFIFYSIQGIKGYEKCNSIIYEIAKSSIGYGRVMSVTELEPLNDDIKRWILEESSKNNILSEFLAALSFSKVNYVEYFYEDGMDYRRYETLTKNLSLYYEMRESFVNSISTDIISIYCEYFEKYKYTFDNIYVMCVLLSLFYKAEGEKNIIDVLKLSNEEEKEMDEQIDNFLKNDYSDIVKYSINNRNADINKIVDVAIALDIDIRFDELSERLNQNPFELAIYNYVMTGESEEDKDTLADFAVSAMDFEKIASGKEYIYQDELDLEYIEDYCLYLLILYMNMEYKRYIEINIKALKARYVKTRIEALNNLKDLREKINKSDLDILKMVYDEENDAYFKKELSVFLESLDVDMKSIKKINIDECKVGRHVRDIYLTDTVLILNEDKRVKYLISDLSCGEVLYIKVNEDSKGNELVVINNEGFMLGNVSESGNYILKNLINYGKIIYGVVKKISGDYDDVQIELYLSYEDVIGEVSNAFNMVINNPEGYLN